MVPATATAAMMKLIDECGLEPTEVYYVEQLSPKHDPQRTGWEDEK